MSQGHPIVKFNRSIFPAFVLSAALAAAVWALSVPLTGKAEPWDADSPYYLFAPGIAGGISGALVPRHPGAHYLGAMAGQVASHVAFLETGPLFVLGLAFLAAYGLVFLVAVMGAASLRTRMSDPEQRQ